MSNESAPLFIRACTQAPAGEPAPLDALANLLHAFGLGFSVPREDVAAVERLLAGLRAAVAKAEGSAP